MAAAERTNPTCSLQGLCKVRVWWDRYVPRQTSHALGEEGQGTEWCHQPVHVLEF
jgi:hypothetical protein